MPEDFSFISYVLAVVLGGVVTVVVNWLSHRQQFKTDFAAERTAKRLLRHRGYTDRSFDALQKSIGGFEDDELRKLLVRAGAIRAYRDGTEYWRLLSRMDEYLKRKKDRI